MKLSTLLSGVALSSLFLTGCGKTGDSSTPSASGAKPVHLAFVTNNAANFWTIARRGTELAVKEDPSITVDFQIPSENTAAAQKTTVDDLLAKGVDGLAISLVDPANQVQFINDAAKQALIFTQDSDAPNSDRACYIGTDNKAAGRQAGEVIKNALPDGGKIMVFVGKIDSQNAQDRLNGIKEIIAGTKIEIVDVKTDNADTAKAKSNVSDSLVTVPDLVGCVGLYSYNGPAILNAVKEAGKVGKIKIICFDEDAETLAGVKDGSIVATVVQQPFEFGHQAILDMAKYIRGDKSFIPAEKRIIIPTLVIDKDKADDFTKQLNERLGK